MLHRQDLTIEEFCANGVSAGRNLSRLLALHPELLEELLPIEAAVPSRRAARRIAGRLYSLFPVRSPLCSDWLLRLHASSLVEAKATRNAVNACFTWRWWQESRGNRRRRSERKACRAEVRNHSRFVLTSLRPIVQPLEQLFVEISEVPEGAEIQLPDLTASSLVVAVGVGADRVKVRENGVRKLFEISFAKYTQSDCQSILSSTGRTQSVSMNADAVQDTGSRRDGMRSSPSPECTGLVVRSTTCSRRTRRDTGWTGGMARRCRTRRRSCCTQNRNCVFTTSDALRTLIARARISIPEEMPRLRAIPAFSKTLRKCSLM